VRVLGLDPGLAVQQVAGAKAARPLAVMPPAAAVERPDVPPVAPGAFPPPAAVPPGLEVPFPCRPGDDAAAPVWSFGADGVGLAALVAGDELVLAGVDPEPTLTALSLATGAVRLEVPIAPGLSPLAVDAGVVVLGRGGDAPLLEARALADGAVRWTAALPPGPARLVAAGGGPLVVREGPANDGSFRLVARDPATGAVWWTRTFDGAASDGPPPHVLRSADRVIVSYPVAGSPPLATLAAVDLAGGELLWSRHAEGRLERILADAEGRLHVGLRAGIDPAVPGAGYVLSLGRDGMVRWELRRGTVAGPGDAPVLDGPALAGGGRLLLVAADLLEGSTGARVGHAPFGAPAALRVAGDTAFGLVSRSAWYDAALYGLDLGTGRPRFAIGQPGAGPHWHLAGAAPTTAGSLLAAFSVVAGAGAVASLCELDGEGRAVRVRRLSAPPAGGTVAAAFAAGDRWLEVIEVDRPWPEDPRVLVRAFPLDGFSPPEPARPLGSCSGEVSDTCG
jgi:hypothetical protein